MRLYDNLLYKEDVAYTAALELPWEKLKDRSVLISGASGLVGSFLVDVIMKKNADGLNCKVYAVGRNAENARVRFEDYSSNEFFTFIAHDINKGFEMDVETIAYVIHLASNTHPVAYSTDPIGTITTNIMGTDNMLKFACAHRAVRFAFASSNEIYGENRGDTEFFDERYCGYLDPNTLRAGYPESKRCGEALCQAYRKQNGLNIVIPRLTRSYGPTMKLSDTKAVSQFIKKGIAGEDIVLKSTGMQYYSYTYVSDAVSGLLMVLLKGEDGEAYNISDSKSDIMLKDLAQMIADVSGTRVVYDIPDETERAGYSTATKARLDGSKLKKLGWTMQYDMKNGIKRTVSVLKSML